MPRGKKKKTSLTPKQRRFVELFDGNATEAARKAGYAKPGQEGHRLLKKAEIRAAIRQREQKRLQADIASREERQAFWSRVMRDQNEIMKNRLKASELLARSQADFVTRHQVEGELTIRWLD